MKTQQTVEQTIMQILDNNLQLDMPHPVAARKKVTKEIIELFDQQTANLKLINAKQGELVEFYEEKLSMGEVNSAWLLKVEIAALQSEPTAMEMIKEDYPVIAIEDIDAETVKRWYQYLVGKDELDMKHDIHAMARASYLNKHLNFE